MAAMIQVGDFEIETGLEGQLFPKWTGSQIPSKLNFCMQPLAQQTCEQTEKAGANTVGPVAK